MMLIIVRVSVMLIQLFLSMYGWRDIFKGLGDCTLCQNDPKSYTDPSELDMLLTGQSLKGGARPFRSSALGKDL